MTKLDNTTKICLICGILLITSWVIVFIVSQLKVFLSVLISGILVYGLFAATLYIYRHIYNNQGRTVLQLAGFAFCGKLVFLGIMFFIVIRFVPVDIFVFFISFIILFTIFLGLEIILIYRRIIFK